MKEEARGGWRATNATNGKVVACSFCAAVTLHECMRGEGLMESKRTTPSFTFMNITTPNDKLVLMKKLDESSVRQSMPTYLLERGVMIKVRWLTA